VAEALSKFCPNEFIFCKGKWKCLNGKYWQDGDLLLRKTISGEFYYYLVGALEQRINLPTISNEEKKTLNYQLEFIRKNFKTTKFKRDVVYECQEFYTNNEAKFDYQWNLLAFNNLVYDLKTHQFREHRYDDFISITTGYDWREPPQQDVEYLEGIFRMIQPVPAELECLLRAYSTGIEGRVLLYFIILNGRGQNGKTFMNNLMLECLGSLAMTGNNSLLTEPRRTGSQPELANIHQKNFVIFEEPKKEKKLLNSNIKELTGGNKISARQLYSGVTELTVQGTFMLACNQKPNMAEDITDADMSRILDIKFNSRFVKPELYHLVNEEKHIYKANEEFKTDEFKRKYGRCVMMKILMTAHQRYANDNFSLKIPHTFLQNTKNYLEKSSRVMEWFQENYEKTADKEQYIQLGEVYAGKFKDSELYQSMSKGERAQWMRNTFIKYFEDSPFTGDDFVERKDVMVGEKRTTVRNILIGYKANENQEEKMD
jgi:phage/plasmid-associated DNA primase